MARRKKPNKQQANRVLRKAEEQDIFLGGSKLPEGERRKTTGKGGKLNIDKARKKRAKEEEKARKGRAPAKVPEPKDRHAPRKSELEKEYTKELQKLRNRLRYREKQGFFVKWESLPSRPTYMTQEDINKLKQYEVQMNENGEIELHRFEYSENAREMPKKLRINYKDRLNYSINNDPNFVPPMESVQNFDVFQRIEDTIIYDLSLVQNEGTQLDHPLEESKWIELSNSVETAYQEALQTFRGLRDSPKRHEYADYLVAHEYEITEAIDAVLHVSDQDQLDVAKSEMLRYLQIH